MKSIYGKALTVSVLVLTFTCQTFAGVIHTDGTPLPAANGAIQHPVASDTPTANGEIHTSSRASTPEADTLTEAALNLLRSVLALF